MGVLGEGCVYAERGGLVWEQNGVCIEREIFFLGFPISAQVKSDC